MLPAASAGRLTLAGSGGHGATCASTSSAGSHWTDRSRRSDTNCSTPSRSPRPRAIVDQRSLQALYGRIGFAIDQSPATVRKPCGARCRGPSTPGALVACHRDLQSLIGVVLSGLCDDGAAAARPTVMRRTRACSEASRETEPEVVVAEGRIELAAQRGAADRVRVAPRSAACGTSHALVRASRIPFRRSAVIILVVPIGTPLVHVGRDAEKAEGGRLAECHRPWRLERPASAVRNPLRHHVTPREERLLRPAGGEFPLGFGRQPDAGARPARIATRNTRPRRPSSRRRRGDPPAQIRDATSRAVARAPWRPQSTRTPHA